MHLDWVESAGAQHDPEGLALVDALWGDDKRVKVASIRPGAEGIDCWMSVSGPREPMRHGLQDLVGRIMPMEYIWLVRWLLGRWPRGRIVATVPLSTGTKNSTLGIIAPLMPTRIALSQSPVPFDSATVSHFKALHESFDQPGLLGCRLTLQDERVTQLSGRWEARMDVFDAVFSHWGLGEQADLATALVQGLSEGLSAAPTLAIEATYGPTPTPQLILEIGPLPVRSVLQLQSHVMSVDSARSLAAGAKTLRQKQAFRVAIAIGPEGIESITTLLGVGREPRGSW
jgi:hypothetical protein